ncbi:MAG: hypothetical protein ACOXZW_03125 [Bacilli bacterium]|jgi:hypothetical protein|nr:hypothetical protein [Bacilli bacterium]
MKNGYTLEYENEVMFKKLERSVKKYNMLAYKKLVFSIYPSLRDGNFQGELISVSRKNQTKTYQIKLPTAPLFSKVHGDITLHYIVYESDRMVLLTNITPVAILDEGHRAELSTYKGVMISKKDPSRDMFKINLLNMIQR